MVAALKRAMQLLSLSLCRRVLQQGGLNMSSPAMKSRKRSIIPYACWTAGFVAFVAAIGFHHYRPRVSASRADASTRQQSLKVDADRLNLGAVWEQPRLPWTLPIHNDSDRVIEIDGFGKSCSCTDLEPSSLKIPPGESRDVQLALDLRSHQAEPMQERAFDVTIFPIIKGKPNYHLGWTIRGRVCSALRLLAPPDFGEHSECAQPLPELKVPVETFDPSARLLVVSADDRFAARLTPTEGKPTSYELRISARVRLGQGPIKCDLVLILKDQADKPITTYKIAVSGHILGNVQATPRSLSFGAKRLGETMTETVVLDSAAHQAVELLDVAVGSKDIEVTRLQPCLDDNLRLRIVWRLSKVGAQTDTVTFTVRSDDRTFRILVPLDAYGVE
jgi:hypothetical protein